MALLHHTRLYCISHGLFMSHQLSSKLAPKMHSRGKEQRATERDRGMTRPRDLDHRDCAEPLVRYNVHLPEPARAERGVHADFLVSRIREPSREGELAAKLWPRGVSTCGVCRGGAAWPRWGAVPGAVLWRCGAPLGGAMVYCARAACARPAGVDRTARRRLGGEGTRSGCVHRGDMLACGYARGGRRSGGDAVHRRWLCAGLNQRSRGCEGRQWGEYARPLPTAGRWGGERPSVTCAHMR